MDSVMEETEAYNSREEKDELSSDLVQIKATSEEEVHRRINAFIRNKRNEVDEKNIREFISPFGADVGNSCARVEAIYVRREGQKSHISLKHVKNLYGPQTQQSATESGMPAHTRLPLDVERREAIEERLSNMETHLQMSSGHGGIYERIKTLEERIMFLEGLSPEYFASGIPPSKAAAIAKDDQEERKTLQPSHLQNQSLSSINKRIDQLKHMLKSRTDNRYSDSLMPDKDSMTWDEMAAL